MATSFLMHNLRLYCLYAGLYYCKQELILRLLNKLKIFAKNGGDIEIERY